MSSSSDTSPTNGYGENPRSVEPTVTMESVEPETISPNNHQDVITIPQGDLDDLGRLLHAERLKVHDLEVLNAELQDSLDVS